MDVKHIGFHPGNRGTLGVGGWHMHDVAMDCATNGISLRRYNSVDICKIPLKDLPWIREANRLKCRQEPLMPRFSEDITHVCLTCTHFVHAIKLAADGGWTLWNKADGRKIVLPDNEEAQQILT